MKAIEPALRRLIVGDDTLKTVWNALVDIWRVDSLPQNLDAFFDEREALTCHLEETLERTFRESYEHLLAAASAWSSPPWEDDWDGLRVIVDGISVREACLFMPWLREKGYKVDSLSFSLSALPSVTESFARRALDISQPREITRRHGVFVSPPNNPVPQFPSPDVKFLWLRLPDRPFHFTFLSPSEVFDMTAKHILEILHNFPVERFLFTSDHGYVYATKPEHLIPLGPAVQKDLGKVFRGKRYAEGKEDVPPRIIETYCAAFGNQLLIRSRHILPMRDRRYFHGGLSFSECLVPVLKVSKV